MCSCFHTEGISPALGHFYFIYFVFVNLCILIAFFLLYFSWHLVFMHNLRFLPSVLFIIKNIQSQSKSFESTTLGAVSPHRPEESLHGSW
jgi:hypothetical protein